MRGIGLVGTATALVLLLATSPALAVPSFFDIITGTEVVTGPPYPTACHRTDVAHETAGVFERDGQLALGVRSAGDGGGLPLGTDLLPVGGEPGDGFSDHTTFSIRYCAAPGGSTPSEALMELPIELTSSDGRPGRLVALSPKFPMCDPRRYFVVGADDERAEIRCRVEFARGVEHELELMGEVPVGLTLTGVTVAIHESDAGSARRSDPSEETGFFTTRPDGFFDVRFHVAGEDGFLDQSELLSMTFTGRFIGGTSPVETTTWGAVKALYEN